MADDGRGVAAGALHDAGGVGGMRERAMLVGGRLSIAAGAARRHRGPTRGAGRVSMPLRTNIVIADDHPLIRTGLRMVLDAAPDLRVVGEAVDGVEAVERALGADVHLAILDVAMPLRTGLQAARELTRRRPDLRILMLSMHDTEDYFFQALKAGASGYVLKTVADRDLVEACRAAMRGEPFLSPPAVRALMRAYLDDPRRRSTRSPPASSRWSSSSPRPTPPSRSPAAGDQPAHGRAPPREHPRQARHARPRRADPVGDPPRTDRRMIRVAILDDHYAIRLGLEAALRAQPDMTAVGAASNPAELAPLLYRTAPDVLIVDYQLPGEDGLSVCLRLRAGSARRRC